MYAIRSYYDRHLAREKPRRKLTHFDARGAAHMVDVGAKRATRRVAIATGRIRMQRSTLARLAAGDTKKGDVRNNFV